MLSNWNSTDYVAVSLVIIMTVLGAGVLMYWTNCAINLVLERIRNGKKR